MEWSGVEVEVEWSESMGPGRGCGNKKLYRGIFTMGMV